MKKPRRTPIERFMQKIEKNEHGCWIWKGSKMAAYGGFRVGSLKDGSRRRPYAHRWIYEETYGPIPDGLFVCHKCDVKLCCNPAHLFLGTNSQNILDAVGKKIKIGGPNLGESNGKSKLSTKQVIEILQLKSTENLTYTKLSQMFGVSGSQISMIVNRKNWKHVTTPLIAPSRPR